MSVTAADVKAYAPEFASLADPAVPLALADALVEINATVYGNLADKATKALAAHLLAVSYHGLYAGAQVQSETVGAVSRTYAVPMPPSGDDLTTTRFGVELRRIRRLLGLGAAVS